MRRPGLSLIVLATAACLGASTAGFAADDVNLFPPDMLEQAIPAPMLASTLPVDEALPTASTRPQPSVRHAARIRPWQQARVLYARHPTLHAARHIPSPVTVLRVAQSASPACPGFCGSYVLVGVGF